MQSLLEERTTDQLHLRQASRTYVPSGKERNDDDEFATTLVEILYRILQDFLGSYRILQDPTGSCKFTQDPTQDPKWHHVV